MERLLEVSDVARVLGVTPLWVRELCDSGRLPLAARTVRGARLFDPTAVERFRLAREAKRAQPRTVEAAGR